MINLGGAAVKVLSDGWTAVTRDRSLSAQHTNYTVGVTGDGGGSFHRLAADALPAACRMKAKGGVEEAPHYFGHRERLRDRLREAGPEALADYEMLELVLFRAIPRRDVKPLAKDLLAKFGTFAETIAANPLRLAEVDGMSAGAISEFAIVEAAAQRLAKGIAKKRLALGSWSEVIGYCRSRMAYAEREEFRVLFLVRTACSPTKPWARARSTTPRSIRAKSCDGRSNCPRAR